MLDELGISRELKQLLELLKERWVQEMAVNLVYSLLRELVQQIEVFLGRNGNVLVILPRVVEKLLDVLFKLLVDILCAVKILH